MTISEILVEVEAAGAEFLLDGERVRVLYPDDECRVRLSGQIALLRDRREEVAEYLKDRVMPERWLPYVMPKGVRLVSWNPKPEPIGLDMASTVVNVRKFVESELLALDAKLNNPWVARGGFSVPQILDRLAQAGVVVVVGIEHQKNEN